MAVKPVKPIKSPTQQDYEKELRRLKRFIKAAEKRGFSFPVGAIPKTPKTITAASVTKLRSITPEKLYKKSEYTNPETNIRVKGKTPQQIHQMLHLKGGVRKRVAPEMTTGRTPAKEVVKKPPLTPEEKRIRAEYAKQKARIRKLTSRAAKRGYEFDDIYFVKPDQVTAKELEKLKALTPKELYSLGYYIDPKTGKIISGTERRHQEYVEAWEKGKQKKAEKAYNEAMTRLANQDRSFGYFGAGLGESFSDDTYETLLQIEELINQWSPDYRWNDWYKNIRENNKNTLKSILDGAINSDGREVVARRLQNNAMAVIDLVETILYASEDQEAIQFCLVQFATIVKGSSLTVDESIDITEATEALGTYN